MKGEWMFRRWLLVVAMAASLVFMIPAAGVTEDTGMEQSQGQSDMQTQEQGQQGAQSGVVMDQQEQEQQQAETDPNQRIDAAIATLQGMKDREGDKIPANIIQDAEAIAIFPEITKAGLIVGGRYGTGVLMVRQDQEWNGPLFLSIYGASIGAQIGVQQTDLVMVFNNQESLKELQDGSLEFGAEASVAAGPYGEKAGVSTEADILAYSQTEGGFVGISLSSGYIEVNPEANDQYFQQETGETRAYYPSPEEMIQGKKAPETEKAGELTKVLDEYGQAGQQQSQ